MRARSGRLLRLWGALSTVVALAAQATAPASARQDQTPSHFRFRTGIDLVNLAVTVTDRNGHFVSNLTASDFVVYEDNRPQTISHFANERVPVSLGVAIDTSGSMAGDKIVAAREALRRFLEDLLGPDDEVFVYRFSDHPELVQEWTHDRRLLRQRLGALRPNGGTALYDTVAEAVPLAQTGQRRKKALVVISDGNDTSSSTSVKEVRQQIRQTEVLVYAVGIDGEAQSRTWALPRQRPIPPGRPQFPPPFPGGGRRYPRPQPPGLPVPIPPSGGGSSGERVNEMALREMTDDSGGRTEIIRSARDLGPATAGIADELSRHYFIGYPAAAQKDGQWHSIRVDVRNRSYRVRARRGYVAS